MFNEINFHVINSKPVKVYSLIPISIDFTRLDLARLKELLLNELNMVSRDYAKYNIYKYYINDINDENFYKVILLMYNAEGFLFKYLSENLKDCNIDNIKSLQVYYICLLASIEYESFNSYKYLLNNNEIYKEINESINKYGKFNIYAKMNLSHKDIVSCKNNPDRFILSYEFLSFTLNKSFNFFATGSSF